MIPASFQSLIADYQSLENPREKFQFLLELSEELPEIDSAKKTPECAVKGCASNAWVAVNRDTEGKIHISGAAEAQISKGMLAFFSLGLSGCTPQEVLLITDEELENTGVITSLSPSRANGALSTWKKIHHTALSFYGQK
ncbi:MAG: SufE family protein [Candidatus Peregrinibacteria bacterium]